MSPRQSRLLSPARPGPVLLLSLAAGLAWMALELLLTLSAGRVLVPAQLVERMLALLPWQLALFGGIGAAVALLARLRALTVAAALWWVLGAGSFAFFGEALLEGLLRKHGPGTAIFGLAALALGLAALAAASLAAARRLEGRWARGLLPAVWVGFSLLFLLWMQHSIAAIRLWEPGLPVLYEYLRLGQLGIALAGAVLVALAVGLSPRGRAGALAGGLLLLPLGPTVRADAAPGSKPDVLVLLIDTLRFDHVGADVGVAGLTPALDALARESVLFTRGFSPGNYTKLALPGIVASLPYRAVHHPLPDEVTTLAEHLQRAGYDTYGISANPYITARFGYGQGFDRFLDPTSVNEFLVEGLLEAIGVALPGPSYHAGLVTAALYYAPASAIRRRALEFFRGSPGPTFVYLQTMDPHGPYLPPHRYLPDDFDYQDFESYFAFGALKGRGVLGRPDYQPRLRNLRQRYRGEVRFTDDEVGKLVAGLRQNGRWDEMLVVMLSDHGEAFGEKDWAGHSGKNVSSTLVQVPFLVKLPRSWGVPGRVEPALVSTYDVLPTLLSLLGLPAADPVFGRDLTGLLRGGPRTADRIVVSFGNDQTSDIYTAVRWPWKLDVVLDRASGVMVERALYDLGADPKELTDVSADHEQIAGELAAAVQTWRGREDGAAVTAGG